MPMARRMMRRRGLMAGAATVSMVSSARRNRAERQAIEGMQDQGAAAAPQDDMTAQLQQLKGMLDQGLITQEEFDAKKKQLLGL